jgi:hypothetical protein
MDKRYFGANSRRCTCILHLIISASFLSRLITLHNTNALSGYTSDNKHTNPKTLLPRIIFRAVTVCVRYWRAMDLVGWVRFPAGVNIYSSPQRASRLCCSPSIISKRFRGVIYPGLKREKFEAKHSLLANVEVRNGGALPPLFHTSVRRSA